MAKNSGLFPFFQDSVCGEVVLPPNALLSMAQSSGAPRSPRILEIPLPRFPLPESFFYFALSVLVSLRFPIGGVGDILLSKIVRHFPLLFFFFLFFDLGLTLSYSVFP